MLALAARLAQAYMDLFVEQTLCYYGTVLLLPGRSINRRLIIASQKAYSVPKYTYFLMSSLQRSLEAYKAFLRTYIFQTSIF